VQPYQDLEHKYGQWIGNPNTVACATGTAALHLALEALCLPPGSEVLVPEFTMVACARAVTMAGLVPVFVDCDPTNLLVSPKAYSQHIGPRTRAIMVVHIYGRQCDMVGVSTLAAQHNLAVVEDLAEAHGIAPHPASTAACWSFYRNKIIAGEEGGMVAFKQQAHATKARQLRSLGFTPDHDFKHIPRGVNARLSNCHATLILGSLATVEDNLTKRTQVCNWYDQLVPPAYHQPPRAVCWVYDICLPSETNTSLLVSKLNTAGVAARLGFKPMSEQPEYAAPVQHLAAYRASRQVVYLPVQPRLEQPQVRKTVQALLSAIQSQSPPCGMGPLAPARACGVGLGR